MQIAMIAFRALLSAIPVCDAGPPQYSTGGTGPSNQPSSIESDDATTVIEGLSSKTEWKLEFYMRDTPGTLRVKSNVYYDSLERCEFIGQEVLYTALEPVYFRCVKHKIE